MTAVRHNLGWPNKPMVATAPTSLEMHSRRSWRRHIGQPLGSHDEQRCGGQRAMSDVRISTNRADERRSADNEATSDEQRETRYDVACGSNGPRATRNVARGAGAPGRTQQAKVIAFGTHNRTEVLDE